MALECPSDSYAILDSAGREGFSAKSQADSPAANAATQAEAQQLQALQYEFQSKLSRFAALQRSLVDDARTFVDSTDKHNPYLNENVRLSNGPLGYVTTGAIFKPYLDSATAAATMGKNGCPSGEVAANVPVGDYVVPGTSVPTTPSLLVGTPMIAGQPCTNFGRNVRVEVPDAGDSAFLGMYDYNPAAGAFTVQRDLAADDATIYQSCQQRAADTGSGAFGLGHLLGPDEGIRCAVGAAPPQPPKQGEGLQDHVGWSQTFSQDISTFGLKPAASAFTVYGTGPLWSAATRAGCGAAAGGSLVSDVLSTYGAICNTGSAQPTSNQ
jgi:hypothetical protein